MKKMYFNFLCDLTGKLIYSSAHFNTDYFLLDVSGFSQGMYLIQVEVNNELQEVQKLIVE